MMIHRAALTALREQKNEASPDHSAVLAHHAYNGEAWPEAAEFALQSMSRSIARSANREALRSFELGMDAARRIPIETERLTLELGLLTGTLGALLPLGRVDEILKNLERAGVIARQLGDTRREAVVLLQLAVMLWTSGKYLQGLQAAGEASAAAASAGSRSLQMAAAQARMMLNHGLGRYSKVLDDALEVERQFAAELGGRRIMTGWAVLAALNVKVFLADVLARKGDFDAAQEACDAGYRELEGHEHVFSRVLLDCVQGGVWIEQGRYGQAVTLLRSALQSCQANDVPTMYPPIFAALALAMALDGQADAAVAQLRQAIVDRLYLAGGRYNEFYFARSLAIALAQAGRYEEALAAAVDAREKAASHGQSGHEVEALYAIAEIEMMAGRHAQAMAHFQTVEQLARQCAMTHVQQKAGQCKSRISAAQAKIAVVPH
jgi:tetratricopeptide (TPR) repeat protein